MERAGAGKNPMGDWAFAALGSNNLPDDVLASRTKMDRRRIDLVPSFYPHALPDSPLAPGQSVQLSLSWLATGAMRPASHAQKWTRFLVAVGGVRYSAAPLAWFRPWGTSGGALADHTFVSSGVLLAVC